MVGQYKGDIQCNNETGETFDIGALIGANAKDGTVTDITLEGTVEVLGENATYAVLDLGGVIGQNSGTLSDVYLADESSTLTVTNNVAGGGTLYTGGLVGYNTGTVENSTLTVTVDGSGSQSNYSYIGVAVGYMNSGTLRYCSLNGKAQGGLVTKNVDQSLGQSYLGGMTGALGVATVEECNTFARLTGHTPDANGVYAAGGIIGGVIRNTGEAIVRDCTVWQVPDEVGYVGWLVGRWGAACQQSGNKCETTTSMAQFGLQDVNNINE